MNRYTVFCYKNDVQVELEVADGPLVIVALNRLIWRHFKEGSRVTFKHYPDELVASRHKFTVASEATDPNSRILATMNITVTNSTCAEVSPRIKSTMSKMLRLRIPARDVEKGVTNMTYGL